MNKPKPKVEPPPEPAAQKPAENGQPDNKNTNGNPKEPNPMEVE